MTVHEQMPFHASRSELAPSAFRYEEAFARNLGWVTPDEQRVLQRKRVAIAGLGGVGGSHAVTLTRVGIGGFHLADFDTFELSNFNRQAGATLAHLGRSKVDVVTTMARGINPDLEITEFPRGVCASNVSAFLDGIDLYVDGLDFFALEARRLVFAECARRDIPAITVAPLGMGAALVNFLPGRMTFDEYFRLEDHPKEEQALRFLVGLAPAMLHQPSLVDPLRIRLGERSGPSTAMGCELCAGIAATEALKILLGRGKVHAAPTAIQFDAFRNELVYTRRPGGNRHPLQRVALAIGRRRLLQAEPANPDMRAEAPRSVAATILDQARWAPSGDNTQTWRFRIESDRHVVIRGFDTRDGCLYDFDGRPSQMALGALLENVRIVASSFGLHADITRVSQADNTAAPRYDVRFASDRRVVPDALAPFVSRRAVQRRALETRPLNEYERRVLTAALPNGIRVTWLEGAAKRRAALLLFRSAKLRLTIPEAYEVHRSIIEWNATTSEDRVPDEAIGLDPLGLKVMAWAMKSWERVKWLNTYLAGTLVPRLELDLAPGLACGAHFALVASSPPRSLDDFVHAGGALQRFWLTATSLGLQLQPELTPLIFSWYGRSGRRFSAVPGADDEARAIDTRLTELLGAGTRQNTVFFGRIGAGPAPKTRSLRKPLPALLEDESPPRD